jgi:hypothetical protein
MRTPLPFSVFALTCLAVAFGSHTSALAQPNQQAPRLESRLAITVEMFCSPTKLRSTNARIRWSIPRAALDAIGVPDLVAAPKNLEVTVYKNGFDKGLMVSLPIRQASVNSPVLPLAQPQARQTQLRAFQIRLIELEPARTRAGADAVQEMGVVVENLEPGMNYTVRLAFDTPSGRMVSAPVTTQATVCPADMVEPRPAARRKQ